MKKALLIIALCFFSIGIIAQISTTEKQALLDIFTSTNGENWINTWNIDESVHQWYGVTIEDNHVVKINLMFNNLDGNLPTSIGQLKNLIALELSFNEINGVIPNEIGDLSQLEILAFNENKLSGKLPSTIGNLKHLKQIHLSSNGLSGTLPKSINELNNLEVFNVFQNQLSGEIPTTLVHNKQIKVLMLAENNFSNTGNISNALLLTSGRIDLHEDYTGTTAKSIIAIETEEDDNEN